MKADPEAVRETAIKIIELFVENEVPPAEAMLALATALANTIAVKSRDYEHAKIGARAFANSIYETVVEHPLFAKDVPISQTNEMLAEVLSKRSDE